MNEARSIHGVQSPIIRCADADSQLIHSESESVMGEAQHSIRGTHKTSPAAGGLEHEITSEPDSASPGTEAGQGMEQGAHVEGDEEHLSVWSSKRNSPNISADLVMRDATGLAPAKYQRRVMSDACSAGAYRPAASRNDIESRARADEHMNGDALVAAPSPRPAEPVLHGSHHDMETFATCIHTHTERRDVYSDRHHHDRAVDTDTMQHSAGKTPEVGHGDVHASPRRSSRDTYNLTAHKVRHCANARQAADKSVPGHAMEVNDCVVEELDTLLQGINTLIARKKDSMSAGTGAADVN